MISLNQVVAEVPSTTCTVDLHDWKATTIVCERHVTGEDIAEITPPNSELLKWAARPENQPPQEWFDSDDDPFD